MILTVLEALRPKQWLKNLVVLAPLVFAERAFDLPYLLRALAATAVFCGLAGAVYVLNDVRDRELDRLHPKKSQRPFAAGRLNSWQGYLIAGLVLAASLGGALALDRGLTIPVTPLGDVPGIIGESGRGPSLFSVCLVYLALSSTYIYLLKHVALLDVILVSLGFVLRAVAGAVVIHVDISHWLLVCTIFLALFLSLAKRRHEVVLLEAEAASHRRSLGQYDVAGLDQLISIVAAVTLMAYALYTTSDQTVAKFGTMRLSLTIPCVIYGLFRYLYLVRREDHGGDPSQSLLSDGPLLGSVALWGLMVVAILYL